MFVIFFSLINTFAFQVS